MAVHFLHMPVAQTEARRHVVGKSEVDRAVIRHPVVVPQEHQLAELQVAGERNHLLANALLQATVAHQRVGVVINDVGTEHPVQERLGDRHAGRVGDALAERAGRHLDAAVGVMLRMAFAMRAELTKAADVVERDAGIAAQMQKRVDQHRAVAVQFDEAVAVEPGRVLRVELQVVREQRRGDIGSAERRAGVALAGMLDRVHRQEADRVCHAARINVCQRSRSCDCLLLRQEAD